MTTITEGSALLLILSHLSKNRIQNQVTIEKLKKLYIIGIENPEDFNFWKQIKTEYAAILEGYTIDSSMNATFSDPIRRYFESHLSLEILNKSEMKETDFLASYLLFLNRYLRDTPTPEEKQILNGVVKSAEYTYDALMKANPTSFPYLGNPEFGGWINELKNSPKDSLWAIPKAKLWSNIIATIYFSILKAREHDDKKQNILPFSAVYNNNSLFTTERGRVGKDMEELKTQTQNWGLLKTNHPIPPNDPLKREDNFPYHKPSDNSNWTETTFTKAILATKFHTFSNGISGFVLIQCKFLAAFINQQIEENKPLPDAEELKNFYTLVFAGVLLNGGGHSLYEFFAVFKIDEVKEFFKEKWKVDVSALFSFENTLYHSDHQTAIAAAIEKTIDYQNSLLNRQKVMDQLKTLPKNKQQDQIANSYFKTKIN